MSGLTVLYKGLQLEPFVVKAEDFLDYRNPTYDYLLAGDDVGFVNSVIFEQKLAGQVASSEVFLDGHLNQRSHLFDVKFCHFLTFYAFIDFLMGLNKCCCDLLGCFFALLG
ncbi:MAG: hypothetical protein MUP16_04655 [Sedimentisphaerales bacterium]|nr:hypothetical protein [Sedimentisphaerales bacterium]